MQKPMTSALALALTATLGLAPGAFAQTETDETQAEQAESTTVEVNSLSSGPKRMKVPSSEAEEADAPVEETEAVIEMLPEAGATEPEAVIESAAAEPETEKVLNVFPEGDAIGAEETVPEAEPEEVINIFPEGDAIAAQDEPAADVEASEPEPAAEETAVVVTEEPGTGPFVGDYTIGDPDAPVQVIEYASFTCPHCAAYHINGWPELKADYIDTGKIGFTLREVYFDRYGLWASMTARCGGEAAFYPISDQLLKKQSEWTGADDIGKAIQQIGRLSGLTDDQLKACLENQEFAQLLVEDYQNNAAADEVRGTPTFVIDGPGGRESMSGNNPDEVRAAIDAALGGS